MYFTREDLEKIRKYIKTHILKKTKILSMIGIILFTVIVAVLMRASEEVITELNIAKKISLFSDVKERVILLLLILLAGWVPYLYIPLIAWTGYIYMLAGDIAIAMSTGGLVSTVFLNSLPILIDILTVSVITSVGLYMCSYTTKKHKYNQRTTFSFDDFKIQLYKMTKKQEKYEEAVKQKQEKIDKMQENNVKIDYMNILRIAPIIMLVNIIAYIMQLIINN